MDSRRRLMEVQRRWCQALHVGDRGGLLPLDARREDV
jgi:hypothetical protein